VLLRAGRNIWRGQVFDENFLMSLATVGAFFIGKYPEGVAVMLFYQVGELFQDRAVDNSRKSIAALMDIRPDYAHVLDGGRVVTVAPEQVTPGQAIVIRPGERVPLDGVVIEGASLLDTAALTGESVPREAAAGDEVLSGCINLSGALTVRVTKAYGESTVSKILDLVENAGNNKSRSERFITRFAAWYTPVVVIVAALLAVVPPLVIADAAFSDWLYRALIFLVISCPCALVISVPLSFFGGIGGASKRGILVKGGNYLETLAAAEIVVFDKTGTLTKGVFAVQHICAYDMSEAELLELTAYAESFSLHPISRSLQQAYGREIDSSRIAEAEETAGHGIRAVVDGREVWAGNERLMRQLNLSLPEDEEWLGTVVHVAVDGKYAGHIVIADEIRDDAFAAIAQLKAAGVAQTVMLTGDIRGIGEKVAARLGMDAAYTELLPAAKVERVEALLAQTSPKGKLIFVGDGINDAPVLARADIGVAMGGLGSDAAIEAADIVIMTDEPARLVTAIKIARRTLRIARQNVIFALAVKALVLAFGAAGAATMWQAVFADVGVALLAVLNALRVLNTKNL
ncbi:MAG: heavy metal translocating P-type ATPase, partial [Syntrophomonadaceae bacterium]|nr:heavy metal translocating P-type ATPase [Syntrophomonadaceae bacterium]